MQNKRAQLVAYRKKTASENAERGRRKLTPAALAI
jgi:hypothetical protein